MYYLGVDLGGTNIKAALVDADGAIIKEASTPTKLPRPAEAVCDDIAALCNQLAQGQQVAGIGVGCFQGFPDLSRYIRVGNVYRPDPEKAGLYAKIKDIYGKLYEANKDLMHEL